MTGRKPKWWRRFWIESAVFVVSISVLDVALYLFKIIDLNGLTQAVMWWFAVICITYTFRHIMLDVLSDKAVLRISKIGYTLGGVSLGTLGGMLLSAFIIWAFNIPKPATDSETWFRAFLHFGVM